MKGLWQCLGLLLMSPGWCPGGSGHQWAPGQSVAVLWVPGCIDMLSTIGCPLDLGQGEERQSSGPAYTPCPGIALHREEPSACCTSGRSDSHSEDFLLVPNFSQGIVVYGIEVCGTLQGCLPRPSLTQSCHPHALCFWQFGQKHAHQLPAGGHFVGL